MMAVPTLNLTVLLSSLVMSVLVSYVGAQAQQSSFQVCDCNPYYSLGCLCVSLSNCDSNKYIVGQIPDLDFDDMEVLSLCRGIEFCCRIPRPQNNTTKLTTIPTTTTTTTMTTSSTAIPTTTTTTTTTTTKPAAPRMGHINNARLGATPATPTTTTNGQDSSKNANIEANPATPTTTTNGQDSSKNANLEANPATPTTNTNGQDSSKNANLEANPATTTTTNTTTTNGQDSSKNANLEANPATTTTTNGQDSSFNYTDCGLLRITATSRRAPWVAALFKTSEDGRRSFLCAGSIVHPSVVMTAGGCLATVSQNDSLSVVAGLTLTDGDAGSTQQELQVESVFRSEYYDPSKQEFDFMLMRLVAPFTRDPSVDVVCLSQPDSRLDLDRCLSAGLSSAADGTLRQRQTDVVVRSNSVCESKLWDIMGEDFVLPIGMTCAEGPSLCQEDYGGPVSCPLVPDPTRYVQVGILSKPLSRCGGGGDPDDVPALVTSTTFFGPTIQWMLADIVSDNYAVHPTYNNTNQ